MYYFVVCCHETDTAVVANKCLKEDACNRSIDQYLAEKKSTPLRADQPGICHEGDHACMKIYNRVRKGGRYVLVHQKTIFKISD